MSYISACLAEGETAVDLYVKANEYKDIYHKNSKISWSDAPMSNDVNKIARDCIYYMKVFNHLLLYTNEELELLTSLLNSEDNDNYKIAEQILRNVKLKE